MSSTSEFYVREVKSQLFNIKWELGDDTRKATQYRACVNPCGSYSHMVFKMTCAYPTKTAQDQKKFDHQRNQVKEDSNVGSGKDKENENADNSVEGMIDEDAFSKFISHETQCTFKSTVLTT